MPLIQEITSSIYGAWRLVLHDADGMRWLNLTVEGFWRSFLPAVIILPFAVLLAQVPPIEGQPVLEVSLPMFLGLHVVEWIGRALILLALCAVLGLTHRFVALIIAWNWADLLIFGFYAVALILRFVAEPISNLAMVVVVVATFAINYFIARTTLDVAPLPAFGIVSVIFLANLLLLRSAIAMSPAA